MNGMSFLDPKALAIPIVAMANADGGMLAIGISDKTRKIEGVNQHTAKLNELLRVPILIALVQYHHNLASGKLLRAARGDDGAVSNGMDGVIIKGYTHFGEGGGQTYLADEIGKEVNALVGILYQPNFLRPTTELFFCALVDVSIEDWV